jgi:hypothetical protein
VPGRPYSMLFLLWRFPCRNLLWFWWVYLVYYLFFLSYSLQYSFSSLCTFCFGVVLFGSCLFGVLEASFTWMGIVFCRLQNFSVYFVELLCIPIACTYSLSLMPIILRFHLLMESVSSWIFLSQVFSCLSNSCSDFPLITISFSSSEILSSVLFCWNGLPFCFAFLFHSFFWGFQYHGSLSIQCCQFSSLIHLSLYLWCFLFHFGV